MERRPVPWPWVLLGCGCLLPLAVGGMILLGLGWLGVHMTFSKEKVGQLAGEIVPGLSAPPGYHFAVGTEGFGERKVEFEGKGRSGENDTSLGVAQLARSDRRFGMDQAPAEVADLVDHDGPVLESEIGTFPVGGQEIPSVRQVYQAESGRRVRIVAGVGDAEHRPVLFYLDGPEDDLDLVTFREFCAKARLDGFRPLQAASSGDGAESEP